MSFGDASRLVAVYDVFDILSAPNPPLYVMPASQAYRTWQQNVPFPMFVAAHLTTGPPPPPQLHRCPIDGLLGAGDQRETKRRSISLKTNQSPKSNNATTVKGGLKKVEEIGRQGSKNRKNASKSNKTEDSAVKKHEDKPPTEKKVSIKREYVSSRKKILPKSDESYGLDVQSSGNSNKDSGIGSCATKSEKSHKIDSDTVSVERYPANPSGGGSIVITKTKSHVICRLEYSREFVLQCSLSPWTKLSPAQMPYIVHHFPELLPSGPISFCPSEYKMKYNKFHNVQLNGALQEPH